MQNLLDTIRRIDGGHYGDQADEQLGKLVKAVNETGKKGTLTLTISVQKAAKGSAMTIVGKYKTTMPPQDEMQAILFADENGRLSPNKPGYEDDKTLFSMGRSKPEKIINVNGA